LHTEQYALMFMVSHWDISDRTELRIGKLSP
jgi:hypothetical protein